MKVRLTESQYQALLEIISNDEAFEKDYIKKGYKLVAYVGGRSLTFLVYDVEADGTIYMSTTKKFPIDLRGVMVTFVKNSFGATNDMKLIKSHKLKKGTTDEWEPLPKPTPYTLKGVNKIDILDESGKNIETIISDDEWLAWDEKRGEKEKKEKRKKEKGEKRAKSATEKAREINYKNVMDLMKNDPILKKAFYHQPKLWNLISIGDPVGISTTKDLINRYYDKKLGKSGEKLKKDSVHIVNFHNDLHFSEEGHELDLRGGADYKVKVEGKTKLKSVPNRKDFNFKIFLTDEIGSDEFRGTVVTAYTHRDGTYHTIKKEATFKIKF